MKKLGRLMVVTLVAVFVGGGSVTASAAAWHTGTPKALRGNWQRSYKAHGAKISMHFKVQAKAIHLSRVKSATTSWTSLQYQQVGKNTYRLRGTYQNGKLVDKAAQLQITKKNQKIQFKNAWASSYDYLGWYHK